MSVDRCFYVDNCLQSLPSKAEAKYLLDKLRSLLASGGFEIRQWASNAPDILIHLKFTQTMLNCGSPNPLLISKSLPYD